MAKFRLMNGRHSQVDADGVRRRYYSRDPERSIVESDQDLEARFGRQKFQRLGQKEESLEDKVVQLEKALKKANARIAELENQGDAPGGKAPADENAPEADLPTGDEGNQEEDTGRLKELHAMTVDSLREYAEAEEIDLGDARLKDEIIQAIFDAERDGEQEE